MSIRFGIRPASFAPAQLYPTANANGPYTVVAGTAVLLRRLGSSDPYVQQGYECYWTPGDGRPEQGPYIGAAGDISVTYATAGTYRATLRVVSQTTGLEAIAYATVVVQSVATVAIVVVTPGSISSITGQVFTLWATAYDGAGNQVTGLPFQWHTNNPAVAILSSDNGAQINVTLGVPGETVIWATCNTVDSSDVSVTVSSANAVYQVVLTPTTQTGAVGTYVQFVATVTD